MKYFITLANFCISTKRKLHKVALVYCRCIHDSQRTFALGIQWCIARLLGTSFLLQSTIIAVLTHHTFLT